VTTTRTPDSFVNFQAKIGYGTGNAGDGAADPQVGLLPQLGS